MHALGQFGMGHDSQMVKGQAEKGWASWEQWRGGASVGGHGDRRQDRKEEYPWLSGTGEGDRIPPHPHLLQPLTPPILLAAAFPHMPAPPSSLLSLPACVSLTTLPCTHTLPLPSTRFTTMHTLLGAFYSGDGGFTHCTFLHGWGSFLRLGDSLVPALPTSPLTILLLPPIYLFPTPPSAVSRLRKRHSTCGLFSLSLLLIPVPLYYLGLSRRFCVLLDRQTGRTTRRDGCMAARRTIWHFYS